MIHKLSNIVTTYIRSWDMSTGYDHWSD